MDQEEGKGSGDRDELPRHSLLAAIPKRTFTRVLVLIAALLGILYLRERTSSIAGCMSDAFRPPTPASDGREHPVRARIAVPADASKGR